MLAYAFTSLRSNGYSDLSTEEFENISELLAAILTRGINHQAKAGLKHDYIQESDVLFSPKGKIDISSSIKQNTLMGHQVACEYDSFSSNCYLNRILKTAGTLLLKKGMSRGRKRDLRRAMGYLAHVDLLDPHKIKWKQQYDRNSQTYRMLVSVCRLVVDGHIHSQDSGSRRLEEFDEEMMSSLYERFILEYFRQEHADKLTASASHIRWAIDDDMSDLLPDMRTDITLETKQEPRKILIIDAKYYARTMQLHFDKKTVHSNNLYQVFTYVKNRNAQEICSGANSVVSGMLLYAQTDEGEQLSQTYKMSGNEIHVRTLDLDCEFAEIQNQLDVIAEYCMNSERITSKFNVYEYAAIHP